MYEIAVHGGGGRCVCVLYDYFRYFVLVAFYVWFFVLDFTIFYLKAASEFGLHYFQWQLAHAHTFTSTYHLCFICFLKARIILTLKVVPAETFRLGGERVIALHRIFTYYIVVADELIKRTWMITWHLIT